VLQGFALTAFRGFARRGYIHLNEAGKTPAFFVSPSA
jgi:hypothetical protein